MSPKNKSFIKSKTSPVTVSISSVNDELKSLKGYEQIVKGFMKQDNLCFMIIQGMPPEVVMVNRGVEKISGYSIDEIKAFTVDDFRKVLVSDNLEEHFARYCSRIGGGDEPASVQFELYRKDGKVLTIQAYVNVIELSGAPASVITMVDLTSGRESEKAVRESSEKYKLLFNKSPIGIFYFNTDMTIIDFNDKFASFVPDCSERARGFNLNSINDNPVFPCLEAAIKGKNGYYKGNIRCSQSNSELVISLRTEPVFDETGHVTGGAGIIEDITKTREAEDALARSEENFKDMIDKSPMPIVVLDNDSNIIYTNRECYKFFGAISSDRGNLEAWWRDVYPDPEYRDTVFRDWVDDYQQLLTKRETIGPKEYRVTCYDGTVRDIEFHIVPVGDFNFVLMNDMTRHRKAEAELLKRKKIESLGIMAGGIAHDYNNILTAIIGNINLARMDAGRDSKGVEFLENIEKAAWRARDLTRQLLTFSRGGEPVKKIVSLKQVVVDAALFAVSDSEVHIEFRIPDNLLEVEADEGQIAQVVHNIVMNSLEAISGKGAILISAENIGRGINDSEAVCSRCVKIRVEDSGPGISPGDITNIFDPFYTTKESATGLGLSVSYSIIKKHNGDIRAYSAEGEKTVFEIILPAAVNLPVVEENNFSAEDSVPGRILVMDDEELILEVVRRGLSRMGYDVKVARNGEEAVSLYREFMENGNRFDCVVMDLIIPGGMGGSDAMKELLEYDPEITAIVSSGYSSDPVMANYEEYGFSGVTEKPYSIEKLKFEVDRAISNRRKN